MPERKSASSFNQLDVTPRQKAAASVFFIFSIPFNLSREKNERKRRSCGSSFGLKTNRPVVGWIPGAAAVQLGSARAGQGGVMLRVRYKGGTKMGTRQDGEAADDAELLSQRQE